MNQDSFLSKLEQYYNIFIAELLLKTTRFM